MNAAIDPTADQIDFRQYISRRPVNNGNPMERKDLVTRERELERGERKKASCVRHTNADSGMKWDPKTKRFPISVLLPLLTSPLVLSLQFASDAHPRGDG